MPTVDQKIQEVEKKIAQQREQLRDLKAITTRQDRKDDTRRKILYGAAYLVLLKGLNETNQEKSLTRLHAYIVRPKDRAFLGLPTLTEAQQKLGSANAESGVFMSQDLPFNK